LTIPHWQRTPRSGLLCLDVLMKSEREKLSNEFLYLTAGTNQVLGYDIGDEAAFKGRIIAQNDETSLSEPFFTAITPNGASLRSLYHSAFLHWGDRGVFD
jgi:hypothetical protein